MELFTCGACGQTVYFHNVQCVRCGRRLGFSPDRMALRAFEPADGHWVPMAAGEAAGEDEPYDLCANYHEHDACNWMVPAGSKHSLCLACRLNRTIPDLSIARNRTLWLRLQVQKNRLVYQLLHLGLPVQDKQQAPERGLAFDFLVDVNAGIREAGGVVIGHADGVITLDVAEADDAVRERNRENMSESYRTILGHFRHEVGHYYWDRLVRDTPWLESFRRLFGDEREPYQEALARHYADGPPADWPSRFVTAYASCHPWEDWAESWAHYLHMVDTLETAWHFGLTLEPRVADPDDATPKRTPDPFASDDFDTIIEHWLPVTVALNSLNHSMGQPDAYPFVLAPPAVEKLRLVHRIIRECSDADRGEDAPPVRASRADAR